MTLVLKDLGHSFSPYGPPSQQVTIPKLKQANVTKVKLGIIQTFMDEDTIDFGFKVGNLDLLHDPHVGGIYKRNYSGVEEPRPGYIINACMKLLYCFDNAEIVKDLILSKSAEGSRN